MKMPLLLDELWRYVNAELKANCLGEALAACNEALKLYPLNAQIYRMRFKIYFYMRDYTNAKADFIKLKELHHKKSPLLSSKSSPENGGHVIDRLFELLKKPAAEQIDGWVIVVKSVLDHQDYQAVLDLCDIAEIVDLYSDSLYVMRAIANENLSQQQEAFADFAKALKINPHHINAYLFRGELYLSKDVSWAAHAASDFGAALKIDAGNVQALIGRARALIKLEYYKEAKEYCYEALDLDPENYRAYDALIEIYSNEEANDLAIIYCDKAIKIKPTSRLYNYRASAYIRMKAYKKAIADTVLASQLSPKASEPYFLCCCAQMALGLYANAMQSLDNAAIRAPEAAEDYINGMAKAKLIFEADLKVYITQEPSSNYVASDDQEIIDRVDQFEEYVTNLAGCLKELAEKDKESFNNHLYLYYIAKLYADCPYTYHHRFKLRSKMTRDIEQNRLNLALRHYINALANLLPEYINGVNLLTTYALAKLTKTKAVCERNEQKLSAQQNGQLTAKDKQIFELLRKSVNIDSPEAIASLFDVEAEDRKKLFLEIILAISTLCVKSKLAADAFTKMLPENFRASLKAHLHNAEKLMKEKPDLAAELTAHLQANATCNIFHLFNVKVLVLQEVMVTPITKPR